MVPVAYQNLAVELEQLGRKQCEPQRNIEQRCLAEHVCDVGAGYAAAAHNPCLTIPMGFRKNNQPAGLTFIGKSGTEQILYELGYSYESISKKRKAPNN